MNQIFTNPPTLVNEQIELVPMQLEHAEELYQHANPEIWEYMLVQIETMEQFQHWMSQAIEQRNSGTALPFIVKLRESGEVIGTTRLYDLNLTHRTAELGSTWYSADYQRSFVNTTCKLLLLKYCFEKLDLIRVQIKTDERNIRSQKAIERMGATKEGILRNERQLASGYIRNAVVYSIIRKEWPQVKEGLIAKLAR
ncbi:GNAT family N-acetyltransferase [Risungbinella massiliensis]|uniref:GNAT family N-acetyltransferase n=1 Tax=Risungbinella massiliensis TaxID=1329796 RepID=UPI0005CBE322|nr:GNAT family protein [Risungbinella massiliensis]